MNWRVNYRVKTRDLVMGHHLIVEATSHKDAVRKATRVLEHIKISLRTAEDLGLFRVQNYNNYEIGKVSHVS